MERRTFLISSCGFCLALGTGAAASFLESCASIPVYHAEHDGDSIIVPLSRFAQGDVQFVQAEGLQFEIAVKRIDATHFSALLLKCTHAANRLMAAGSEYACTLHGSRFDAEGAVLRGPAQRPLERFTTEIDGSSLRIRVEENRSSEHLPGIRDQQSPG